MGDKLIFGSMEKEKKSLKLPSVSIIVPVYNAEPFLHRCIDSILLQSYTDFELILVDDGSVDKSGMICDGYVLKDNRIKVIHGRNKGVSSARNQGLKLASGEYIVFIDADDFVANSYIRCLVAYGDFDLVTANYNVNTACNAYRGGKVKNYLQTFIHCTTLWGKLYNKKIIKVRGLHFDEDIRFGEDTLFYLSYLLYCKNIAVIPDCGYHYMTSGISSERYNLSIDDIHRIGDKILQCYWSLENKYDLRFEIAYDKAQLVSMYPLKNILTIGDDEYYGLYRSYFPQAEKIDLYQDRFCSPMGRTISLAKNLYLNGNNQLGRILISSAYGIYNKSFGTVQYPYRLHGIIGRLIGCGWLHAADIILILYAFLKNRLHNRKH